MRCEINFRQFWTIELKSSRILTEAIGQTKLKLWFLIYRYFLAFCWTIITILSATESVAWKPFHQIEKYLIYLTHWDLILGSIQAILGATLVTKRWTLQKNPNFNPDQMYLTKLDKTFWFLNVAVCSVAVTVTVIYWVALYNPNRDFLDPNNIFIHVCNTILILMDIAVSKVPFKLSNFWWSLTVVLAFLVFSGFYQLAGGTNYWQNPYIYNVLDWRKPLRVFQTSLSVVILIILTHSSVLGLLKLRNKVIEKYCIQNQIVTDIGASSTTIV